MKALNMIGFLLMLSIICNSRDWITYTNNEKAFQIKFPSQPTEDPWSISYNPSDTLDSNKTYSVHIVELPAERVKAKSSDEVKYENVKEYAMFLVGLIAKPLFEEKIWLQGNTGIYVKGEILQPPSELHDRIYVKAYLVNSRIYTLMVACKSENEDNKDIFTFFDSFELIE